ncbi:DUF2946 family protein [Rhodopseudomonas palustris]|uniref:DUF2946 family protein n=1 Tax=Rhodopseudomonas palustris TaxID=1076 RepID=UPI00031D75DE
MDWFRSNIRTGVRLALIALALQFGLAFGHVHASQLPGSDVAAVHGAVAAPANGAPQPTPQQDSDDDGCAICAVMAMAQALIAPSPPLLPLPGAHALSVRAAAAAVAIQSQPHRGFQPRAPPTA